MFRNYFNFFALMIIAVFISSCGNKQQTVNKTEDQYFQEAQTKVDEKKFPEAIAIYEEFIKAYPKSEKVHDAYNKIAGYYITEIKDTPKAIETYKMHYKNYPDSKQGKNSLFLVAFTYDEVLKDKDNAIKAYEEFLVKFPTDTDPNEKFSESAKVMLENLKTGGSIEDLIKKVESQNNTAGDKNTETKTSPEVKIEKVEPKTDDPNKDVKKETK